MEQHSLIGDCNIHLVAVLEMIGKKDRLYEIFLYNHVFPILVLNLARLDDLD